MCVNEKPLVILIDTNAMATLSLYVESCKAVEETLGISIDNLKNKFVKKGINYDYLNLELIKNGYKLFRYLEQKREERNIKVWFSLLSEIELLDIFLDRTFDLELTRKCIPYRIRRKKPFRIQIDFDYETRIANYWEDIKHCLNEKDIGFDYIEEEEGGIPRIVQIARIVTKYIALEPVDLYLYAAAIHLRADEIYTRDGEFKDIINNIVEENNWKNIREKIQKDLRNLFREFAEEYEQEGEIILPKGVPQ